MRKIVLLMLAALLAGGVVQAKVRLVYSDWHLVEPVWARSLEEAFAEFQQMYPDIEVVLDPVSAGEKTTKWATALAAGKGPDVLHIEAHMEFAPFVNRGWLLDLTPYIEEEGPGFLSVWSADVLDLCRREGRFYALPGDIDPMLLVYNARMFYEAGLNPDSPPKTWDEFLSYARQLTRDINGDGVVDTWGFAFPGTISTSFQLRFLPLLYSFGAEVLTSDMKCCALNTPEAKEAFQFLVDLALKYGVMAPGVAAMGAGQCRELMAFEKVAMLIEGPWTLSIIDDVNPDLDAENVLRVAPVPVKAGYSGQSWTTAQPILWVVNANTEHPREAWLLVKFLTSKSIQEKFWRDNRVIPSRLDVSGGGDYSPYPELAADRWSKSFAEALPHVKFIPQIEEWPEIIELVNVAAQEAWTQQKTALDALEDAYEAINRLLVSYRLPGEKCPPF